MMDTKTKAAYSPQSIERMRARYPLVLKTIHSGEDPIGPECIFDGDDGLRLQVSHEKASDFGTIIHVSASPVPGTPCWERVNRIIQIRRSGVFRAKTWFVAEAERRFREISGDDRPLIFSGFNRTKGFPEWWIRTS